MFPVCTIIEDAYGGSSPHPQTKCTSPGLYQIIEDGRSHWLALNSPLQESLVASYSLDDWERMGIPFSPGPKDSTLSDKEDNIRDLSSIELESQQKLWRWVIIIAAILLAMESLIAIILGKREKEAIA